MKNKYQGETIESLKPLFYIHNRFPKNKYGHSELITYINDIPYNKLPEYCYQIKNFGKLKNISDNYILALQVLNHDHEKWGNDIINKNKAFCKILESIKNKKTQDSITPLLPFEIYLLKDGFEMVAFGGLNAYCPNRIYKKREKVIILYFGSIYGGNKINFSFELNYNFYQVSNKEEDYHNSINEKMPKLI